MVAASTRNRRTEGRRTLLASAVGAVTGLAIMPVSPWQLTVLVGWIVAAALFAALVWRRVWPLSAEETRAVALREDESRAASRLLILVASVISLVGVGVALLKASQVAGAERVALTAAAVLTVATSWILVHTVFTLRYADTYYGVPEGGIDFSSAPPPDYSDFAYVAFTIGMTFQVSDTTLTSNAMRRIALRQALLAFLYLAVILATTINIAASFIR